MSWVTRWSSSLRVSSTRSLSFGSSPLSGVRNRHGLSDITLILGRAQYTIEERPQIAHELESVPVQNSHLLTRPERLRGIPALFLSLSLQRIIGRLEVLHRVGLFLVRRTTLCGRLEDDSEIPVRQAVTDEEHGRPADPAPGLSRQSLVRVIMLRVGQEVDVVLLRDYQAMALPARDAPVELVYVDRRLGGPLELGVIVEPLVELRLLV